jgi:hypothetical protein
MNILTQVTINVFSIKISKFIQLEVSHFNLSIKYSYNNQMNADRMGCKVILSGREEGFT